MRGASLLHIWQSNRHAIIPAMVAVALCLPGLTQGALATDTAWYSAIALQSWRAAFDGDVGSLWTLRGLAEQPYFNKPPLAFWLNGLPLALLGPSVLAARLGSVIAAVLCVLAAARLGRLLAGHAAGLASGLVLAVTWEFIRHTHAFSLDLWLALFLTLSLCAAAAAHVNGRSRSLLAAGLWIGLGLMVKPLVALLAFIPIAAWLCGMGRRAWWPWLVASIAAAVLVAAPWHLSMWSIHGDAFASQYFGREVIERATSSGGASPAGATVADFNIGSERPWYYLIVLVSAYWPWLATFALGVIALVRREGTPRLRNAVLLSLVWSASWLILLSLFPDKRPRYLLIVYPAASLCSAIVVARLAPSGVRLAWRALATWAAPAVACIAAIVCFLPVQLHRPDPPQWPALFEWLREQGNPTVHIGAFAPQRCAQVFLATGRWPVPTQLPASGTNTQDNDRVAGLEPSTQIGGQGALRAPHTPIAGDILLYHRRDGLTPGQNEEILFTSGDLTAARLVSAPWAPIATPDPGERHSQPR